MLSYANNSSNMHVRNILHPDCGIGISKYKPGTPRLLTFLFNFKIKRWEVGNHLNK